MKSSILGILLLAFSLSSFSQITVIGNSCGSGDANGGVNTCAMDAISRDREASARAREANARAKQIELQNQTHASQGFTGTAANPHPVDAARVLVNTFDICVGQKSGIQFCTCYADKMSKSVKVLDHFDAYGKFLKGEKYNLSAVISISHQKAYAFCDQAVGFGK